MGLHDGEGISGELRSGRDSSVLQECHDRGKYKQTAALAVWHGNNFATTAVQALNDGASAANTTKVNKGVSYKTIDSSLLQMKRMKQDINGNDSDPICGYFEWYSAADTLNGIVPTSNNCTPV